MTIETFRNLIAKTIQLHGGNGKLEIDVFVSTWEPIITEKLYEDKLKIFPEIASPETQLKSFVSTVSKIIIHLDKELPEGAMVLVVK